MHLLWASNDSTSFKLRENCFSTRKFAWNAGWTLYTRDTSMIPLPSPQFGSLSFLLSRLILRRLGTGRESPLYEGRIMFSFFVLFTFCSPKQVPSPTRVGRIVQGVLRIMQQGHIRQVPYLKLLLLKVPKFCHVRGVQFSELNFQEPCELVELRSCIADSLLHICWWECLRQLKKKESSLLTPFPLYPLVMLSPPDVSSAWNSSSGHNGLLGAVHESYWGDR